MLNLIIVCPCVTLDISHTPDQISSNLEEIMHLINVFPRFEITVIGPKGGVTSVIYLFIRSSRAASQTLRIGSHFDETNLTGCEGPRWQP